MNKVAIICKLHEITDHNLLGAGSWPAHREFLPRYVAAISSSCGGSDVESQPCQAADDLKKILVHCSGRRSIAWWK
jgi:hypothetical protein